MINVVQLIKVAKNLQKKKAVQKFDVYWDQINSRKQQILVSNYSKRINSLPSEGESPQNEQQSIEEWFGYAQKTANSRFGWQDAVLFFTSENNL